MSTAMMAITTSSSMSVNAVLVARLFMSFPELESLGSPASVRSPSLPAGRGASARDALDKVEQQRAGRIVRRSDQVVCFKVGAIGQEVNFRCPFRLANQACQHGGGFDALFLAFGLALDIREQERRQGTVAHVRCG